MLPTSRQKSPCYLAMTTTTTFSTTTVTNLGLRRRTQRPRYREPGSKEAIAPPPPPHPPPQKIKIEDSEKRSEREIEYLISWAPLDSKRGLWYWNQLCRFAICNFMPDFRGRAFQKAYSGRYWVWMRLMDVMLYSVVWRSWLELVICIVLGFFFIITVNVY